MATPSNVPDKTSNSDSCDKSTGDILIVNNVEFAMEVHITGTSKYITVSSKDKGFFYDLEPKVYEVEASTNTGGFRQYKQSRVIKCEIDTINLK